MVRWDPGRALGGSWEGPRGVLRGVPEGSQRGSGRSQRGPRGVGRGPGGSRRGPRGCLEGPRGVPILQNHPETRTFQVWNRVPGSEDSRNPRSVPLSTAAISARDLQI